MSLHFESRWQDDEGKWTQLSRADAVDGHFLLDPAGPLIPIAEAIRLARPSAHMSLDRRPFALRIGFSR